MRERDRLSGAFGHLENEDLLGHLLHAKHIPDSPLPGFVIRSFFRFVPSHCFLPRLYEDSSLNIFDQLEPNINGINGPNV